MANMALNGLGDPAELSFTAREIPFPNGVMNRWLPATQRLDHRFRFFKRTRELRRAVPVRPWDTPATPLDRGGLSEVTGRMLPMSGIMWLDEEEKQVLDALRSQGGLAAQAVEDVYSDDLLILTRGILQRVMLMQGEAIHAGTVTIGTQAAPENGLQLPPVDFGIPDANIFDEPDLWDDATPPNFLTRIGVWVEAYTTATGDTVRPAWMVTSTRVFNVMASNEDLQAMLFRSDASITRPPLGIAEINSILSSRGYPQLIVSDAAVPDYTGTLTREFPDNRVILLPSTDTPVGSTQWGVTEESKELVRARALNQADSPGLVAVPMISENPVNTGLLVTGIAMPVVEQPDLIMSVKVLEDA